MQVLSQMFTKHISKVLVLIQEKNVRCPLRTLHTHTHTRDLIITIIMVVRMGALMALWSIFYYSVVYRLHSDIVSMVYCLYGVLSVSCLGAVFIIRAVQSTH